MENNNITNTTTFWELLGEYEIVIPIIQRDYAQGRAGKEELRKNFLGQICNALETNSELLLDFVYGTINNNRIYPLDGQQRLTTLWLLHWYYFYKNGLLGVDGNKEKLMKFSYETRDSSKEFIRCLCEIKLVNNNSEKHIDELIQEQTWFLTKWKHDPTIQAMLRMLSGTYKYKKVNNKLEPQGQGDGIEQLFNKDESLKLLERLVNKDYCPIKFLFLDLEGIKQSDNLYIKMNARGKQLTSFENFKADLIDFIQKDNEIKIHNEWANKWDTEWTDIFWKERDKREEIDNLYFAFIKRYLYNEIALNDLEKNEEILKNLNNENQEYSSFKDYEKLREKEIFPKLCKIFNNLTTFKEIIERKCERIKLLKDKDYKFIPQYKKYEKVEDKNNKKVLSITYQGRVLFYGICEYLKQENIDANNEENLRQWLRILANLTYYDEITNEKEFALRLKSVRMVCDKILGKSSNIYISLCEINIEADDTIKKDTIKKQLEEEQRKIMLISQDGEGEIEEDIILLEGSPIFEGHINCLLDLIVCDNSEKEKICQRKLSKLLAILKFKEFNEVKFKSYGLLRLLFRAILTKYEKEEPNKLLINNEHVGFRRLLNDGVFYDPFKFIMRGFLNLKDSNIEFKAYLENIISNYKNKDWKVCLVKSDCLWTSNFSETMKIHTRNNIVYLYKGTNANKKDIKLSGNQCGVSCPLRKSNTQP